MYELAADIRADRDTLHNLIERLGVDKQSRKQVTTWLAERATRLRFARAVTGSAELSRLLEMEMLSIGIHGKRALWRSLAGSRDAYDELEDIDIDALAKAR